VGDGFTVKTNQGHVPNAQRAARDRAAAVRRASWGVPARSCPRLVYRLIDPDQYKGPARTGGRRRRQRARGRREHCRGRRRRRRGAVYRAAEFDRAKARNRERINAAAKNGQLQVMMKSNVKQIDAESVSIEKNGAISKVRNDAVIVSAGGVLPSEFLKRVGITVETKHGTE